MTRPAASAAARPNACPPRTSVARTHVGRVRSINEDRVLDCPAAQLWAVADGMGGHSGGDIAAQITVDHLRALAEGGSTPAFDAILAAISEANEQICQRNAANGADAGTTIVVATIAGDICSIAWAGDSRAYRVRAGRLDLLTRDHSLVQELVDAGLLTPAQAERHPRANVITRALGVGRDLECQTIEVSLAPDDRILLCSDGLSRSLSPDDVRIDLDAADADRMMDAALDRDGTDNISLILIGR